MFYKFSSDQTPNPAHKFRPRPSTLLFLLAGISLVSVPAHAATQTWVGDGGSGGNGTWSTSTDWNPNAWVAGNVALFGGTAGTVTVGTQTAGGLTFNVGGYTLQTGTLTLNAGTSINTVTGNTTISAVLTGSNGFAKDGAGTLTLTGTNTFTGGITLDAGTLAISVGNNLGASPGTPTTQLTFAGNSTFQLGNNNLVANRSITINSGVIATFDTGTNTGSGVQGVISGAGTLNKIGAGTLTLAGTNTYTGGTTINAGTISIATDANLGDAGGTLTLNGGTLASSQTAGITMTRTINVGGSGDTIALNGKTAASGSNKITFGTTGQLTGSGALTITNNGLLSIGAANTGFSGNWTLNGGVLELTNNQAAGSGSLTINTGAELSTLGSQITNALTLNGGAIGWDYYSGSGNYQGPITLQNGGGTVSLVNFYAASNGSGNTISGTISGNISGGGGLSVSDVNPGGYYSINGTLTLSGNNSYTGGTLVGLNTTLALGSATALGATTGPLSVAGFLTLNGNSPTVGALTMTGTTTTAPISAMSAGTPGAATLAYTFGSNSVESLSVASATLNGTSDLLFNPSNALPAAGIYNLVTSRNGTLGSAWEFAGEENMTAPATSIIVKSNGGNQYDPGDYYRLTLGNNGSSETATISYDVPSKVITIFPFGSSITAGTSAQTPYNGGGYRSQLYLDLADDGRFIPNFVGSSTSLTATNPNEGNILTDANQLANEGHPGWTTIQMLANLNMSDGEGGNGGGYWLKPGNGENPNYITVNIGGNDAYDYGTNVTAMTAASQRLDAIVSEFNTLRPGVSTILSSIVYRGDTGTDGNNPSLGLDATYNPLMPGIVFNHVLAGQNVSFVDLRSVINYTTDIGSDHIHPTQAGYDKMANAWYTSLAYGQAYWTGSQGSVWNTVNGASTNFAMDAGLTTDRGRGLNDATADQYLVYPDVYFSGNTAALSTTLGADTTIRSLNFTKGATGSVTIGAGNTLTIGTVDNSADTTKPFTLQNSGGITVQAGTGAHTIAANIALGADQTWGNVSSNNLTVTGGVSGAHNLGFVGSYTIYNEGTFTPSPDVVNHPNQAQFTTIASTTSGMGGGFVLSGNASHTGTTTISNVTVTLNNAGRLSGTSGITLNTGGILLLASTGITSTDRINNAATLTMAGGTLNTGGLSEGTVSGGVPTAGIGALTLAANSVLDLGAGASVVTFANSSASAWTGGTALNIYNWSGRTSGGGTDEVFFGNNASGLTTAQLSQIAFYSDAGSTFLGYGGILADGEVVPVPEATTLVGTTLLVGMVGYRERRRLRGIFGVQTA